MRMNRTASALLAVSLLSLSGCCGIMHLARTSRVAFSPPLSPLIAAKHEPKGPITERYSYAWQNVSQELKPGAAQKNHIVTTTQAAVPDGKNWEAESARKAEYYGNERQVHERLARTEKSSGTARYHHEMARFNADMALIQQEMSAAQGRMSTAQGMVETSFGIYNSLAAAGRQQGNRNYAIITDHIVKSMNLAGSGAPKGSRLHIEYHYGLEPSAGKKFQAGLAGMFGGSTDAVNYFMVTAVLTLADGRQIASTRLVTMRWYAGDANLQRPFPSGFEEISVLAIPAPPPGAPEHMLNYKVLNILARAAVLDIRREMGKGR